MGTKEYDVKIEFEKEEIKKVSCVCQYHEKSIYCKHIYAVLYELSKKEKEEAVKRYKKYVLNNAKQVNDFFIETNNLIKYNKEKFNKDFFDMYENVFYDLNEKYENLRLEKKELGQLNDYLKIIKQDYEKIESIYSIVLKVKDLNTDINYLKKSIKEKETKKNNLEKEIYSDDISTERLIEIIKIMPDLSFYEDDIKYAQEKINYLIEQIEDVEKIQKIKELLKDAKLNISICDRTIRRLKGIRPDEVENLDKKDLEYFIYHSDDIFILINIKKEMGKYKFEQEIYNYLDSTINSEIDYIYEIDKLKEVKKIMKEYKFNLDYINKAIYNLKHNIYEKNNDPITKKLDEYIESRPMEVLEKVKEDNIKNGKDNRIIQKAIINKKKKIKELNRLRRKQRINDFLYSFSKLNAIFSLFSSDSKAKKHNKFNQYNYSRLEQDEILNGNYEPYQFEEENLEDDDDYYYEDID